MNARILSSAGALTCLVLLAACVHAPLNKPLVSAPNASPPTPGATTRDKSDGDLIVSLYFSGGGMRAAALSYGVLKALSEEHVGSPVEGYRLLDKVRVISAVSGGSFPAAYYCLYHDRLFNDFESQFLKRNVHGALIRELLSPVNWPKLMSPYYGRSDMAAEYYDKILFHGATYADLGKDGGQPRLILNATDMANGEQFPFVSEHFDLIGSDLGSFRISRAVAAASAFPFLLSPITLQNFRGAPGVLDPEILRREAMADPSGRNVLVQNAFQSYRDYRENPYLHLVDGGTTDNLGLAALIDAEFQFGGMEHLIEETLHTGQPRRFVIIVVNASVYSHPLSSQSEAVPGISNQLWRLADNFQQHSDVEYLDLLRIALSRWKMAVAANGKSAGAAPEYYLVSVDLSQLREKANGSFFASIPTNFGLPSGTIDRLIAAGGSLLKDSPDYQRLLGDLSASP